MPASVDALFAKFQPGEIRELILTSFRNSLRELLDPDTGQVWTEDVIRQATIQGSRFWVEANSDEIIGQAIQRRSDLLASQVDPRRSNTAFLERFHGEAAKLPRLEATGASGFISAECQPGTTYVGSTTVPNPLTTQATDESGLTYQVFFSPPVATGTSVQLAIQAISTGTATNLKAGAVLTWANPPAGSAPTCTVLADFSGGFPRETDQEWGERLFSARGDRARAGNPAHLRLWARRASNAVADAFVYPCALNAGTTVVAVVQKRGTSVGPTARIPSLGTLAVVGGYLTPPSSPVVPGRAHIVVVGAVPEPSDVVMRLGMRRGSTGGWADATPWPDGGTTPGALPFPAAIITAVTSPTTFTIQIGGAAPASTVPQLMVWDDTLSRFERLAVLSVTLNLGLYDVVLSVAPTKALAVGDYISPYSTRLDAIGKAVESYFDGLGPGEAVDLETDVRAVRAFRRPSTDRIPSGIDSGLLSHVGEAIGPSLASHTLDSVSVLTPTVPVTISAGPNLLVPGRVAIYDR